MWSNSSSLFSPYTATGNTRMSQYGLYWKSCSGCPNDADDTQTGATRQTATGTYWSTSYCACPTRQTGPYTGYDNYYYLVTEKSVGGVITQLASYSVASQSTFKITAQGSTINVYYGTGPTLAGTITDATHSTATLHGVGLGGATDYPGNSLTYFWATNL